MSRLFTIPPVLLILLGLALTVPLAAHYAPRSLSPQPLSSEAFKETPPAENFSLLWAQGKLAAAGEPEQAYNNSRLFETAGREEGSSTWGSLYPPPFMLLVEPSGYLSAPQAWFVVSWSSLIALALATVLAFPRQSYAVPLLLGYPGLWLSLEAGQLSLLLTVLYMLILASLNRTERPAGVLLGLASFKPHLGFLAPFMLIWRGQWAAFIWAAITVLAVVGATYLRYGPDLFTAYAMTTPQTLQRLLHFDGILSPNLISFYGSLRLLGINPEVAIVIHGVFALMALQILWRICRRALDPQLPVAGFITAALIFSPHVFTYDLILLIIPVLILVKRAQNFGWQFADILMLLVVYLLPPALAPLATHYQAGIMPLVLMLLLERIKQHSRLDHAG